MLHAGKQVRGTCFSFLFGMEAIGSARGVLSVHFHIFALFYLKEYKKQNLCYLKKQQNVQIAPTD